MKFRDRSSDFLEELLALRLPAHEVRWAGFFRGPRENEVANTDIAGGAIDPRGPGVQLLANSRRGFADLIGWPGVSNDRGIDPAVVYHSGVIPDGRRECVRLVSEHETWEDNGRVCFGYEETLGFQVGNNAVCFVNGSFELAASLGGNALG